jgi:hypothetical protein
MGVIMTQAEQVIAAMKSNDGFATFGKLNSLLDFSTWDSKTPEASVRRIVQENSAFFKIKPGLWALTEDKDLILEKLKLKNANKTQQNDFTHSYYQGLIVEIGNMKHLKTYVPGQDRNKLFLAKPLKDIVSLEKMHNFTYQEIVNKAKTVDIVWFNERKLPQAFFEVEHTTNIEHSLVKFCILQDFFARFYIIADEYRRQHYDEILQQTIFNTLKNRVVFVNYENIVNQHIQMFKLSKINCI